MPFDNLHQTPFGDLELLRDARSHISDKRDCAPGRNLGNHRDRRKSRQIGVVDGGVIARTSQIVVHGSTQPCGFENMRTGKQSCHRPLHHFDAQRQDDRSRQEFHARAG
jgi:hypothetical protein